MDPRKFALVGGIFMLVVGVVAFIIPGSIDTLPILKNEYSYGLFLGLFPMNVFNKILLILFGLGGIAAASAKYTALPASIRFSRVLMVVMGIGAILGAIPQTNTLFGYWPLFGNEVLAHGLFAIVGAYFGFALSSRVPRINSSADDFHSPAHGVR
jgi:hypothetical protein